MSWVSFFGKQSDVSTENSAIPGVTPLQQQRIKQIESLSKFNKNVSEDERDKEYRVKFNTAGGRTHFIKISLPDRFPNVKPIIKLTPNANHPWLDEQMNVVGCDTLNNFYMHSNLGKVVKLIIEEFQENLQHQMMALPDQYNDVRQGNSRVYSQEQATRFQHPLQSKNTAKTAMLISTESADDETDNIIRKDPSECKNLEELLTILHSMPMADIEKFSENDEKLFQHITSFDMVLDFKKKRAAMVERNEELAEQNLAYKPRIEEVQKKVEDNYVTLETLQSEFESKLSKQDEVFQVFDVAQIITNFRIAISQAEEHTEGIAERFLEKKMPLEEFLPEFLEQRKLLHLRKAKEERIRYLNPRY